MTDVHQPPSATCRKCGNDVVPVDGYCPGCGTFLKATASTEPLQPNKTTPMQRMLIGACLLVLLLVVATMFLVGDDVDTDGGAGNKSSLACGHFRNVMRDVNSGVLTGPELRSKLKEVEDDAAIAPPDVQVAARGLLAASTTGDLSDFAGAIRRMDSACTAAGS